MMPAEIRIGLLLMVCAVFVFGGALWVILHLGGPRMYQRVNLATCAVFVAVIAVATWYAP